jgi:adenylate cyclase class 2
VVLDDTPIGNYGEIEGPPRWIDGTARGLGITPSQYITDSYAQLFADWKARTGSPAEAMTFSAVKKKVKSGNCVK